MFIKCYKGNLSDKLAGTAGVHNLLLGQLGEELGLDEEGHLGELSLAEDLEMFQRDASDKDVRDIATESPSYTGLFFKLDHRRTI